ncbi:hypothetical protein [Pedobacter frigiditerrae]|uniref:hypothetical protein n=1 Tax=Pedobacter frigiditerrae TaxID=2530452 RepID=UPI00292D0B4A|nr:hypothetical protein [Pedobacter frigiditerrae]
MSHRIFFKVTIVALLYLGVNVLFFFGWDVNSLTSVLESILPAAFLLTTCFIYRLLTLKIGWLKHHKRTELELLALILILTVVQKTTGKTAFFSTIINCLLIPVLVSALVPVVIDKGKVIVKNLTEALSFRNLILVFYVVECVWAVFERLFTLNIFPFSQIGDERVTEALTTEEFRSSALINHPLQNALCVSIIMSFILITSIKVKYKYALWALGFLAILCFNTRSSIAGWIVLFAVFTYHSQIYNKKISVREKSYIIRFTVFAAIGVLVLMFSVNWGQRLLEMGLFDDSSSQARIDVLGLFANQNLSDLLLGISQADINKRVYMLDLITIENFWLIYLFKYGIIFTVLLVILFSKLFKRILNGYQPFQKFFVLTCFIGISSTNNSLAVPSPALAIFILCCYSFNPLLIKLIKNDS